MNQNETWHSDRPRPRPYCVRWGPRLHQKMAEGHSTPNFGPCLLWPNGWVDQDETWHGGRPRSRPHCVTWGPINPHERDTVAPHFSAHVYWPNGWMDATLDGDPAHPTERATAAPIFGRLWHGRPSQLLLSICLYFAARRDPFANAGGRLPGFPT